MADRALVLAIYRGLLRFSQCARGVPYTIRASDLCDQDPAVLQRYIELDSEADPVLGLARQAFRQNKELQDDARQAAIEHGLAALRTLASYRPYVEQLQKRRTERADRSTIPDSLHVGRVCLHKRWNYRGVIYGWDRECDRGEEWCKEMGVRHDQPFFYVLPDEKDCTRAFGGVRISKYVAAENLVPLQATRVRHRGLRNYFSGYDTDRGRYIPTSRLQWEYPADCPDLDLQAKYKMGESEVAADSNMLLDEEEEEEHSGPTSSTAAAAGQPQTEQ